MAKTPEDSAQLLQQMLEEEQRRVTELENANRALVEEFSNAGTYEEQMEVAKKAIAEALPMAVQTIKQLLASADSDNVRASLAKYVIGTVLDNKLGSGAQNDVRKLIEKIAANANS